MGATPDGDALSGSALHGFLLSVLPARRFIFCAAPSLVADAGPDALFGGKGAAEQGNQRNIDLCRVIGERWTEAVNDWDVIGAYRWHRERIKRGTVAPLTAEDARQLLPKDKFALWSRKQL